MPLSLRAGWEFSDTRATSCGSTTAVEYQSNRAIVERLIFFRLGYYVNMSSYIDEAHQVKLNVDVTSIYKYSFLLFSCKNRYHKTQTWETNLARLVIYKRQRYVHWEHQYLFYWLNWAVAQFNINPRVFKFTRTRSLIISAHGLHDWRRFLSYTLFFIEINMPSLGSSVTFNKALFSSTGTN